jgi:hypothetical protein
MWYMESVMPLNVTGHSGISIPIPVSAAHLSKKH